VFHRLSLWWRALGVVLLGLATLTWPSASSASTTPTITILHQDASVTLSSSGLAPFQVALRAPKGAVVNLALYPHLLDRGQITQLLSGGGVGDSPVSVTTLLSPQCAVTARQTVTLTTTLHTEPRCGHAQLLLPCQFSSCDGVYPLRYTIRHGNRVATTWSMVALRSSTIRTPLRLVLLVDVNDTTWAHAAAATRTLQTLAGASTVPLTVATGYHPLAQAAFATDGHASEWRHLFSALLANPLHQAIVTTPAGADFGSLAANGLSGEVAAQLQLSSTLIRQVTGRYSAGAVFVDGTPSVADVATLGHAGVSHLVLHGTAVAPDPSSTLLWGAPETLVSAPHVSELAIDDPLSLLANNAALSPALRATLVLATMSFLHFDAPNAVSPRTVVLQLAPSRCGAAFTRELLAGLHHDPFVTPASLDPSFSANLIGSNALPTSWQLAPAATSTWSPTNVSSLRTLLAQVHAFEQGVANTGVTTALASMVLDTERTGTIQQRQMAIDAAQSGLNRELSNFHIDNSSITLTGQGTALPITIVSRAHYPVTVVVHLRNASLVFTKGSTFALTLSAPTTVVRVPLRHAYGSDVTLQISLTTTNGAVTLDHTAVQVRIAGTSFVGYLLSFAALFVLAMWWWRSYRRTSQGRHAK